MVLATVGGGLAFLTTRMIVSGDGNFLQPFEELGWIDSDSDEDEDEKDDDKDVDKDADDDEDEDEDKDEKKSTKKTSANKSNDYLVEESRLSSAAKKSGIEHYYGAISLESEIGDSDDEYSELYKLMKAGINIYAKDGKAVEIEFGFDLSDFCKEVYKQYKEDFEPLGVTSSEDLEEMMVSMIEEMFDSSDEYSEYMTKYVEGGSFQLYVTEKGFESLYKTYDIEEGEEDIDVLIDALEDAFDVKIELVD